MQRLAPSLNVLGLVILIFSFTMLVPLTTAFFAHDAAQFAFDESFLVTLIAGLALWLGARRWQRELKVRDGFLLVLLVWTSLPAFAALPFLIYAPEMSFTDAYFETISGLTTTGATVMSGLDSLPPSLNLWRHLLNWLGGMGIIVLAVAILPLLGIGGRQLLKAELPGPIKDSKLTPRIADTAKLLWAVYAAITLVCVVALKLAGMSWFDALCHAFATLSLGGFSTHDASVGYYDSPLIEAVLIFFMMAAALNFVTHLLAFRQRSLAPYRHDPEVFGVLGLVIASCLGLSLYVWQAGVYPEFLTALRHVSFNLVSIATDCGFASTDFNQWPILVPMWMLFLSSVTASSGSTGGGLKMIRAVLAFRQGVRELERQLHPAACLPVKIGSHAVPNQFVFAVQAFVMMYVATIVAMTLVLLASGLDFISAFSAVVACINNAGPGLNEVGPASNYAGLSDFQTWVLAFTMLLGRLELFTVFVLFTRAFWRG
ncbi:MAG: TrkH family potassium uptake protein [Thiobacillus sp.]|nr:TrkH family potassium uptake protein [Gammaproteobacteria bacterium]MBU4499157.1 TrkH family potassium uptake protein [Gammaproteobacteria bacterium]MDO9008060.1 TrkH family potassium uptake protein [Thiobacillus sp.]MDP1924699.1 TrkH family potassium uptake protein [Thiobacillus sp.]MDP3124739.1 TrkH family potassium uptake protein [Thiobacillus sp.]